MQQPADPRLRPVREGDSALVRVLEAFIETLKAENEILRRRLAAADARAARETAKAEGAIAELSAIMRLRARAAALGDGGSRAVVEADTAELPEERRRFALINIPRHLFSQATAETAKQKKSAASVAETHARSQTHP